MDDSQSQRGRAVSRPIGWPGRVGLIAVGLGSWAAGAAACFQANGGAGAAGLVAAGAVSGLLGLIGHWPSRISVSGGEMVWDGVRETIDSQIKVAEASGDSGEVLAELRGLRDRLTELQRTGSVAEHPAETYDRAVEAALRRLLPGAEIRRQEWRSREVADFSVSSGGKMVYVETKWRADPDRPFGGTTLPGLLRRLPPRADLLIVANNTMPPTEDAVRFLADTIGDRGRIVTWRSAQDDPELGAALSALLRRSADGTAHHA